jgi:hypothetical protein
MATYYELDPSKNQYCQKSTIKAEKGGFVFIFTDWLYYTEHLIKIGTGLYILKPKHLESGELVDKPVSYVKAKKVTTALKKDGNVFVLQ